ncbi:MAG: TldD/PmbA family protein [Candidatus Heimdallarchaeota archaeon]|nr:TldD/PmbA family protein [Candidatus Heimdallarchaeota archaeon]
MNNMDYEFFNDGLEFGQKMGAEYVEFRYQDKYHAKYEYKNEDLTGISGSREGYNVRVLFDGSWGQSSSSILTKESVNNHVNSAFRMAKNSKKKKNKRIRLAEVEIHEDHVISPRSKSLEDMHINDKLEMIMKASKLRKDYELVKNLTLSYEEIIDERMILTSEGTKVSWNDMKPVLRTNAVAIDKQTGKMGVGRASKFLTMGLEIFDLFPFDILTEEALKKATKLCLAPIISGGMSNVIIGPDIVGLLAHEAIGHTAEADLVQMGSFTQGKLGKKVCDEQITMVDAPVKKGSNWDGAGWLKYDDEGVKGANAELITNGIMTGYMTNRSYAADLESEGIGPTGNARAFTFKDEPIIRMRNTYIEPGDMSFEELIEAVGDGYLLKTAGGGQADTSGEYMFSAAEAYRISNGELTNELFQNPVLTGNAFETLSNILGLGKDFELSMGAGYCGKEQPAAVDGGGPHIAMQVMLAGGK